MKNVLLKSFAVLVLMAILNLECIKWSRFVIDNSYKRLDGIIYETLFIEFFILIIVGFITVLFFRKTYTSLFRVAVLFEILYVIMLIFSGVNPFSSYIEKDELKIRYALIYISSLIVLGLFYIFDKILEHKKNSYCRKKT